ncbi:MAG: methylated-DNA--[Oscillospiraceae bacterium]|nr:methylated-DNA--[protein]-cysteine S-methyltransferase [Oscillospiraceae bacterium]
MDYIMKYPSPVGMLTVASDGESIIGLWLERQKYFAATLNGDVSEKELPVFDEARRWLDIYFSGREPQFLPPIAPRGSEFRRAVWEELLRIPYGETVSYGEIARRLGGKTSARAVGGAVGHNPISIIIPCHRVVGAKGNLTGYAGGVEKKVKLLEIENALK